MLAKFINWLINSFVRPGRWSWLVSLVVFIAIVAPLLITDYFGYRAAEKQLTELTISRRESLAHLASTALKEKFDRIIDVGISLSTRVQFRKLIDAGKWDEAIKILESAPTDFPYIDTVVLFDSKGTVMAVTPLTPSIREVIGKNFAHRDYYQGVSKDWRPYISEVFKRAVEPKYNVVSVAIPIKSDAISDQKIIGILLLTIKLDVILEWAREIEVGTGGFTYFVDRNGHVAGHPKFSSYSDVVDFSEVPVVKKVLGGEKGVEILYNQIEKEERISAYEQVPVYGWGVIVQQPTLIAFASRQANLQHRLITDGITLLVACLLAYFILFFIKTLNAYRQKERIFLESVGDGLVAIDRNWNVTLWNKAAGKITGWTKEETLGKPLRGVLKFIREQDRTENIAFIEEAMLHGRVGYLVNNTVLITKDGREVPTGDSAAPITNSAGGVIGAIIVFRDTTKEREALVLRSDFAYASHQLRTPIVKALWSIETALSELDQKGPEVQRQSMEIAYDSITSVSRLADQILAVSEIDQGTIIPKLEQMKLVEAVDEVIKSLAKKAKVNGVTISVSPPAIAAIQTDAKLFKAILSEILDNAIEYSLPNGKVKINLVIQESDLLIEIRDAGIGILGEQQVLIFTKFFRGSNIDTTKSIGAGLGLFIAREYIKLLKGKIWFKSKENEGTTFSVVIPISAK